MAQCISVKGYIGVEKITKNPHTKQRLTDKNLCQINHASC